jgi:site-specific DNA-cytosine methylase
LGNGPVGEFKMNEDYIKKLEKENEELSKKVIVYEEAIKKLDPTFFQMENIVSENINEDPDYDDFTNKKMYEIMKKAKREAFYDLEKMYDIDFEF